MGNKVTDKLIKLELPFEETKNYFVAVLKDTNIISNSLVDFVEFGEGVFFTLLPKDANLNQINQFHSGGILRQNPVLEYKIEGKKARYQLIPTIREPVCKLIVEMVKKNINLSCIIDDVTIPLRYYEQDSLFQNFGYSYNQEVFFIQTNNNISETTTIECLQASNSFWHSLCILTAVDFNNFLDRKLTLTQIEQICRNAKLILVGAYDGEGYVFWEKK